MVDVQGGKLGQVFFALRRRYFFVRVIVINFETRRIMLIPVVDKRTLAIKINKLELDGLYLTNDLITVPHSNSSRTFKLPTVTRYVKT